MDGTYNLNGGFKPTTKRSADLGGPDWLRVRSLGIVSAWVVSLPSRVWQRLAWQSGNGGLDSVLGPSLAFLQPTAPSK